MLCSKKILDFFLIRRKIYIFLIFWIEFGQLTFFFAGLKRKQNIENIENLKKELQCFDIEILDCVRSQFAFFSKTQTNEKKKIKNKKSKFSKMIYRN